MQPGIQELLCYLPCARFKGKLYLQQCATYTQIYLGFPTKSLKSWGCDLYDNATYKPKNTVSHQFICTFIIFCVETVVANRVLDNCSELNDEKTEVEFNFEYVDDFRRETKLRTFFARSVFFH